MLYITNPRQPWQAEDLIQGDGGALVQADPVHRGRDQVRHPADMGHGDICRIPGWWLKSMDKLWINYG